MYSYEFLPLGEGIGGLEYEQKVSQILQKILPQFQGQAKFLNLDCSTAGFCNLGVDLELDVNGRPVNVELKQNRNAQMGGTSIRYDAAAGGSTIVNADAIDDDAKPYFLKAAESKSPAIKAWIDYVRQQDPPELHANMPYKLPISAVTKDAWVSAQTAGLLKSLNDKVKFPNTSIIAKAYNNKKVFYIQIGGAGLFYLGQNIYNLPVPEFQGEIDIEFRLGPSGSKSRLIAGKEYRVVSATYRCQGRLKTKLKSNLSLDNAEDAVSVIKHIISFNSKSTT